MKAEELMIGDWVLSKSIGKPCKVIGIDPREGLGVDGYTFILLNGRGVLYVRAISVDPLPITPEILEKNGFKKQGFPGWEIYEDNKYMALWRNDYSNVLTINSFSSDYGSFNKFRIDYVHQLQRALKLCNIDINIEIENENTDK